jgi:hypothetical protein
MEITDKMARRVINPTLSKSLGQTALEKAMDTLKDITTENAKNKRQSELIAYNKDKDAKDLLVKQQENSVTMESSFNKDYFVDVRTEIEKGTMQGYNNAEALLGIRDDGSSIYDIRRDRMVGETNKDLYKDSKGWMDVINKGRGALKEISSDLAITSDISQPISEHENARARTIKRVKDGLQPYSDLEKMMTMHKKIGLSDELGYDDKEIGGLTASTINSGMKSLYKVMGDYERVNAPTEDNLEAFINLQPAGSYGYDITRYEKASVDFRKISTENAKEALRQIKSTILLREPGEQTFFQQVGPYRKQELVNTIGGLIIESNPELAKLSREKLAEALNKDKNIKYMSEQFLEYIGPEYVDFLEKANYNLLGI